MLKKLQVFFSLRRIIGAYFLLFGGLIVLNILFPNVVNFAFVASCAVFIFSIDMTVRSLISQKKKYRKNIIVHLSFTFASIMTLVFLLCKCDMKAFWPLYGLCPSISLIIYFCLMSRKNYSILVPGLFLLVFSLLSLFFSLKIITLNKQYVFVLLSASLLIICGALLLIPTKTTKKNETAIENENKEKINEEDV